jgi:hypothetical protein
MAYNRDCVNYIHLHAQAIPLPKGTPTWHPATGIPTRKLLIKRGDTWEPKTEIIGPGYRAAYGLVALVHHQIEGVDEHGELQLMDHRIRTHGTAAYRSVKRGARSRTRPSWICSDG